MTLPMAHEDFSLLTLLSFVRSVDYMAAGSIVSQTAAVAILTQSPLATAIVFASATVNQLFAVSIALWFSRLFQRNLQQGGRSKTNTIVRLFSILMWSFLIGGVGFLFSILWYTVPNIESTLVGSSQLSSILGCIFPFATGVAAAASANANVSAITLVSAIVATPTYLLIGVYAANWCLKTIRKLSEGAVTKIVRATALDFNIKTCRPLFGYIVKDLKTASRNPATAFFFVLPALETAILASLISNGGVLRTVAVLEATAMGAIFTLFLPLALVTAEGKGLEYTKTMPINSQRIILAKTLTASFTYILVPLIIIALAAFKPIIAFPAIFIPFLTVISVVSACIFEIRLFLKNTTKGRISAVANDLAKIIVGAFTIAIPILCYGAAFLLTFNHLISLLVMGTVSVIELTTATITFRRA